jgi:hypothetical protein
MASYCGVGFQVLKSKDVLNESVAAFIQRCKSWDCAVCRRVKASKLESFMQRNLVGINLYAFTFTFYHREPVGVAWQNVGRRWNALLTRIRAHNKGIGYVRVLEPHKESPYPHLHVIFDRYVDCSKMAVWLKNSGFGWNMLSTPISSENFQRYMTKYLTKEWPDESTSSLRRASRCRVVSASRRFGAIFARPAQWTKVVRNCSIAAAKTTVLSLVASSIKQAKKYYDFKSTDTSLVFSIKLADKFDDLVDSSLKKISLGGIWKSAVAWFNSFAPTFLPEDMFDSSPGPSAKMSLCHILTDYPGAPVEP